MISPDEQAGPLSADGWNRSTDAPARPARSGRRRGAVDGSETGGETDGKKTSKGGGGFKLSLKGRALRLLTQREHSRAELEKKLAPHEETPGELAAVLDDLHAKDFISEARVVESVINRRASRFGAARIRHELQQKGLDAAHIAGAVMQLKETEFDRALDVWRRKFETVRHEAGSASAPEDHEARAAARSKQMRFLAARGFSGDVIGRVMKVVRAEARG
jgi:regulatory protein